MSAVHDNLTTPLNVLIDRLFDYAGMFPPASRSFEDALVESAHLKRTLARPWIVANDIVLDVPHAARCATLDLASYGFTARLRICLLVSTDIKAAHATVKALRAHALGITIASLELKASPAEIPSSLAAMEEILEEAPTLCAIEPNLSDDSWDTTLAESVERLATSRQRPALKCRLTGPTAIDPTRLAHAIIAASDASLPFKVTGGLHHPIVEPDRHTYPMGFLNVAAAVMARRILHDNLPHERIVQLLTNTAADIFRDDSALCVGSETLSTTDLHHAKQRSPFTIGSCSLHEPDEGIARLFG